MHFINEKTQQLSELILNFIEVPLEAQSKECLTKLIELIQQFPEFAEETSDIIEILEQHHLNYTKDLFVDRNIQFLKAGLILDLILQTTDLNKLKFLIKALHQFPQFVVMTLIKVERLKPFHLHLSGIDKTLLAPLLNEFTFAGMNVLGVSIFQQEYETFKYLLDEIDIDPHRVGACFEDNFIFWLLTLCAKMKGHQVFYIKALSNIEHFVEKYNKAHPETKLPHPYKTDEQFCPLAYIFSKNGELFARHLMQMIDIDWIKYLGSRSPNSLYPIWMPFLPPCYSPESTNLFHFMLPTEGRTLNKNLDMGNLLSTLGKTLLLKNESISAYTAEERKGMFDKARTVLEHVLFHPIVHAVIEQFNPEQMKQQKFDQLQKLYFYSRCKEIQNHIKDISLELHTKKILTPILNIWGILFKIVDEYSGNTAQKILNHQLMDKSYDACIKIDKDALGYILSFLEGILTHWPAKNDLLDSIYNYGYNKLGLNLVLKSKQEKQFKLKKKEVTVSSETKEPLDHTTQELQTQLNEMHFFFEDPNAHEKSQKIDGELKNIEEKLRLYSGDKLATFKKSYEESINHRKNFIVTDDGFLKKIKPIKQKKAQALDGTSEAQPNSSENLKAGAPLTKTSVSLSPTTKKTESINTEPKPLPSKKSDLKEAKLKNHVPKNIKPKKRDIKDEPKKNRIEVSEPKKTIDKPLKPDRKFIEPKIPEPKIPETEIPEPKIPEPEIHEPEIPKPKIPKPKIPEPKISEPKIPEPKIPEPKIPEPKIPEPKIPEPKIPEPKIPEPKIPEPKIPELKFPEPKPPRLKCLNLNTPEYKSSEPMAPIFTIFTEQKSPCPMLTNFKDKQFTRFMPGFFWEKPCKQSKIKPEKRQAFLEFTLLHFQNMRLALNIFLQRINSLQIKLLNQSKIIDNALLKTNTSLLNLSAYIQEEIIRPFPQFHFSQLPIQTLWSLAGLAKNPKLMYKITQVSYRLNNNDPQKINEFYLFSTWNDFISAHLEILRMLRTSSEDFQLLNDNGLQNVLKQMSKSLHQNFLPLRFKTDEEEKIHDFMLRLTQSLDKAIQKEGLGTCNDTLEHGTQVASYVLSKAELMPRSDTDLFTPVNTEKFHELRLVIDYCIKQFWDANCYNKKDTYDEIYVSPDQTSCMWKLVIHGLKIDWKISIKPFEDSLNEKVLPCAMLSLNLKTGNIFNPVNTFSAKELLSFSNYYNGRIVPNTKPNVMLEDPNKVGYILKIASKTFCLYEVSNYPNLEFGVFIREALLKIDRESKTMSNALKILFGKESVRMSGFHSMMMKYNLFFIFKLDIKDDFNFLMQITLKMREKEKIKPDWTMPTGGVFMPEDYFALIFHHSFWKKITSCKNKEPEVRNMVRAEAETEVLSLASKCLHPSLTLNVLTKVQEIDNYLYHEFLYPSSLCEHFELNDFYHAKQVKPSEVFIHPVQIPSQYSLLKRGMEQGIIPQKPLRDLSGQTNAVIK